jgi:hypothetical protein
VIENERQYQITMAAAERFERALAAIEHRSALNDDVHPLLRKAREDAIRSQLEDLRAELREYERLRSHAPLTHQPARRTGRTD